MLPETMATRYVLIFTDSLNVYCMVPGYAVEAFDVSCGMLESAAKPWGMLSRAILNVAERVSSEGM